MSVFTEAQVLQALQLVTYVQSDLNKTTLVF